MLVSIIVPDKDGKMQEVNLGFDYYQEYDEKTGFMGASVGRFANRIGGAKFTLNGETYTLFKTTAKTPSTAAGKVLIRNGGRARCWKAIPKTPSFSPMFPTTAKKASPAT